LDEQQDAPTRLNRVQAVHRHDDGTDVDAVALAMPKSDLRMSRSLWNFATAIL
jgi:hypothetical protein